MKQVTILLALALVAATSFSCENKPANVATNKPANSNTTVATPLPSATIDELASGRKVYEMNCSTCHKADGTGGPVEIEGKKLNPDNLTSDKIKGFTDEKIIGYVMNGVEDEGMPAFKGRLSEGEIRDVVKYVRTEIQKMPATSPKR